MDVSRRSAPRREVTSVLQVGHWGSVGWVHTLSCGHTDTRKRQSPLGAMVGCVRCVLAERFVRPIGSSVALLGGMDADGFDSLSSEVATEQASIALEAASVASALGVPVDAVDVVWGPQGLQYVMVMLTPRDVQRLAHASSQAASVVKGGRKRLPRT